MKRTADPDDSAPCPKRVRGSEPAPPPGLVPDLWKHEIIEGHLIDEGFCLRTKVMLRRTSRWFARIVASPSALCSEEWWSAYEAECSAFFASHIYAPIGWRLGLPECEPWWLWSQRFRVFHSRICITAIERDADTRVVNLLDAALPKWDWLKLQTLRLDLAMTAIAHGQANTLTSLLAVIPQKAIDDNLLVYLGYAQSLRAQSCFFAILKLARLDEDKDGSRANRIWARRSPTSLLDDCDTTSEYHHYVGRYMHKPAERERAFWRSRGRLC